MRTLLAGASAAALTLLLAVPGAAQVTPRPGTVPGTGLGLAPGQIPLPDEMGSGVGAPASGLRTGPTGDPTLPGLDNNVPGLATGLGGETSGGLGSAPVRAPGLGQPGAAGGLGQNPAALGGPGMGMARDPALGGAQDPTLGGIAPGVRRTPAGEGEPAEQPDAEDGVDTAAGAEDGPESAAGAGEDNTLGTGDGTTVEETPAVDPSAAGADGDDPLAAGDGIAGGDAMAVDPSAAGAAGEDPLAGGDGTAGGDAPAADPSAAGAGPDDGRPVPREEGTTEGGDGAGAGAPAPEDIDSATEEPPLDATPDAEEGAPVLPRGGGAAGTPGN